MSLLATRPSPSAGIDCQELAVRLSDLDAQVSSELGGVSSRQCVVRVEAGQIVATMMRLRDDESVSMRRLADLTAVDRLGLPDVGTRRFLIVYQLHSPISQQRMRVEVALDSVAAADQAGDEPGVDSVSRLWPAAFALECEVYDLFGIRFKGHPDLRRILLDPEFVGAPLRKDHPLQLDRALPDEDEQR